MDLENDGKIKFKLHVGKEIGGWSEEEMVNDVNKCDKQWHRN